MNVLHFAVMGHEATPTWSSIVSSITSTPLISEKSKWIFALNHTMNSSKKHLDLKDHLIFGGPGVENPIINPFKMKIISNNSGNFSDEFLGFYNKFYVSRVLIIPTTILMIFCSITLMFVILRHIKSVIKLYLSVLFYACSILFFALQIISKLIHSEVSEIIVNVFLLNNHYDEMKNCKANRKFKK